MENKTRYWITVVSKDHIARGVAGGFMQANHGKAGPLKKLHQDDWVIFYSPRQSYKGNEDCKAFTAIGHVADDEVYPYKMAEDFIPYRRNMQFYHCEETSIVPLIDQLDFIPNKVSWGYPFRFGFLEIKEHDFKIISRAMISTEPVEIKQESFITNY